MENYTLLPAKKIWFIIGLLSLICVKNINSSTKGCPQIFEVFEYELKIDKAVINNVCRVEYLDDDSSGDNSGESSGDNKGTKPRFNSICSFKCDYYMDFCPRLAEKLHHILIYNYDDFRWKYNDILTVCKKWDELFYTPEPSSTTTTEPPDTIEVETTTEKITTVETQKQSNSDIKYSKGGTIGIVTVIGILICMVTGVSIFLWCPKTQFKTPNLKA